jgi:hypothetical protein
VSVGFRLKGDCVMDIVLQIWLRLLERYAEELFFQDSSSGVFSFLIVGVLAYLYKQEKEINRKCTCCQTNQNTEERKLPDTKEEAE